MTTAKRMEMGIKRRSLRPNSTRAKGRDNFMRGVSKEALSMIFLNPDTKRGREVYISKEPRYGWYLNYGQARMNYRYHATKIAALKEMKEYAELHEIKFKPGRSS
jgi:hypothetical protein